MVIFREGETPPGWCELRAFRVDRLALGETLTHDRTHPKERLLVTQGRCQLHSGGRSLVLRAGQFADLDTAAWSVTGNTEAVELLRLSGTWGTEIAGCGLWTVQNDAAPKDKCDNGGDPVPYPKRTSVDSHYHDYDEYWIVLEGAATAVVSGQMGRIAHGDCLATAAGHHHDVAEAHPVMRAAFFETTLVGRKRMGHLWEHTHGPARPVPGRHD